MSSFSNFVDEAGVTRLRATGGGGGGSTPGAARVIGPFTVTHATPALNDGVAFYTPTVGDFLLDAWFEITEQWDGTTPQADVGTYTGGASPAGLIEDATGNGVDLTSPNQGWPDAALNSGLGTVQGVVHQLSWDASSGNPVGLILPARFLTDDPLKVVVSQNAQQGGDPCGSTMGSLNVWLKVATPAAP